MVFKCLPYKTYENTVGEREIAQNEQSLLFPQCFLPFWRTFHHFFFVVCKCFEFGRVKTLSFGDQLKQLQSVE